jgi:hypothetical protein
LEICKDFSSAVGRGQFAKFAMVSQAGGGEQLATLQIFKIKLYHSKGTVPQDFLLQVFYMDQFPPSP